MKVANFFRGLSNIPAELIPHVGAATAEFSELDKALNRTIWKLRRTDKTDTYFELKSFEDPDGSMHEGVIINFTDPPTIEDLRETHKRQGFYKRLKKLNELVESRLDLKSKQKFNEVYKHIKWVNDDRNHIGGLLVIVIPAQAGIY